MQNVKNINKQHGFSLVEVMVVIFIIGLLMTVLAPALKEGVGSAKAIEIRDTVEALDKCITQVHTKLGWGSNITSNVNYEAGNDALDMCTAGSAVIIDSQKSNFDTVSGSLLANKVKVVEQAQAGTKGVYKISDSIVSLSSTQPFKTLSVEFQPVDADVICELKRTVEGFQGACDSSTLSTADTDGVIQYSASTNGVSTLTFTRKFII
tara:strand:+ start:150 stop:773 length:624 start_codon:yes stop_codon:yes gene_type:complete